MLDASYKAKVIDAAERQIPADVLAVTSNEHIIADLAHRPTMELIKGVVALSAVSPGIVMADDGQFLDRLSALVSHLSDLLLDEGLFSGGDNLVSPPDSGFTINDLCLTMELVGLGRCSPEAMAVVKDPLMSIARKAAPAMLIGGIHTPNHRWEISSALVGLGVLLDDERLIKRAYQWLAEHIDIQSDGLYSERSPNYAAYVSNPCLIAMARRLHRKDFLDIVNKNLKANAMLMQSDGTLETVQSRRQDQFESYDPEPFLSQARLLANITGDADVVAFAYELSERDIDDPARHLTELLIDDRVCATLPRPTLDGLDIEPRIVDFLDTKMSRALWLDSTAKLVRTATVYAGSDFNATYRVASGLANNASLMDYRTRGLGVATLQLAPDFFDIGPLRPTTLQRTGMHWTLHESRTSGYYQPLEDRFIRRDGRYPMTYEGRFFAQMSFDKRHRDKMTLHSTIDIELHEDGFTVQVHFDGPRTTFACVVGLVGNGLRIDGGAKYDGSMWAACTDSPIIAQTGNTRLTITHDEEAGTEPTAYDPGETVTFVDGSARIVGTPVKFSGVTSSDFILTAHFETIGR
ncbi:hypothetical protein [Bifidobacterium moukalabense]|uniref:hypothetical protein n=1 Tax=Bifidobacterium moukalabense TaxID=1333651 RepID=UPI0010F51700|nr:hypothetical protein [Bifidobacterium moukalabense]